MNFIKTTDEHTANALMNIGFQIINESNGVWTFINSPKIVFDDQEVQNIAYSNVLNL